MPVVPGGAASGYRRDNGAVYTDRALRRAAVIAVNHPVARAAEV